MSQAPLTIWCNAKFPELAVERLRAGVGRHRLLLSAHRAGNLVTAPPDESLASADVAFGQPDAEALLRLPGVRWVHITSAGYTRYDREDFRRAFSERGAVLTNSSWVYADPCAQHALAFMLAMGRQLPGSVAEQLGGRGWPSPAVRERQFLLTGQRVLILGYGAIARRLVELLEPFVMDIVAVRRRIAGDEACRVITERELDGELARADHVVNILPDSPATRGYMSEARLAQMRPGAFFYNIGRGTTVDQAALVAALRSGQVAGAYLDVTEPEPLPGDHPLWSAPNCHITPHTAGGHLQEFDRLVDHFLANLAHYERGEPLADRVI